MIEERIEHHECPGEINARLLLAGGTNRFGGPMFRLVWGFDRLVKIHGKWDGEHIPAKYLPTGILRPDGTEVIKVVPPQVKNQVIETREVPKYLPGNCWYLEGWRDPAEYGTPEEWARRGAEVDGGLTIDAAGPYPYRGEYELAFPLTDDGTQNGKPLPLAPEIVEIAVNLIRRSRSARMAEIKAAIQCREEKKERDFVNRTIDMTKDAMPAFGVGVDHVVVPDLRGTSVN